MSKTCPKHPRSLLGAGETNRGACYECLGRPPGWVCSTCKKPLPCEHIATTPALSEAVARARSDLYRTIDAYRDGGCSWQVVQRAIDAHEEAQWKAWCEWGFKEGRQN